MKRVSALAPVILAAALVACGGGSSFNAVNPGSGTWSETFISTSSQQLGSFTFVMTQDGTALTGSNMNFANLGPLAPCFGSGTVMNGQMGPGMTNGGTMNITMTWSPQGSAQVNIMSMQGNMATGMVSGAGNFNLTAQTPGCTSQFGTFTMTHTGS